MNKFCLAVLRRISLSIVDKTYRGIPSIENHYIFIDVTINDLSYDYQWLFEQRYVSCTYV